MDEKKIPSVLAEKYFPANGYGSDEKVFHSQNISPKSNAVSFTLLNLQGKNPAKLIEIEELSCF